MSTSHTKEEIFGRIKAILVDLFEIDEAAVTLDASLVDDLDIDSIDAVDLLAELKDYTHNKVDPDDFKSVHTLADVVGVVEKMQSAYLEKADLEKAETVKAETESEDAELTHIGLELSEQKQAQNGA